MGATSYLTKRALALFLTVVIATYLTIVIVNIGGYIDEIKKSQLYEELSQMVKRDPMYRRLTPEEQDKIINQMYELEVKRQGLDQPFLIKSFIYLKDAITLNLGRSLYITSNTGSNDVKLIILERLPATVLLFTTLTIINFIIQTTLGLYLSRRRGSLFDKVVVSLAPTSVIPGWLYGIVLILIFASYLKILPYGGMVDVPPPEDPFSYALSVLKHMILPMLSWIVAGFFMGIYGSRTFFLLFSSEDYVTMGKAKGIPEKDLLYRYIFRPTLPPIITGLALGLIGSWGGAIITETVFSWPGLGRLTYEAISAMDAPVIIATTIVYAYLLAATVFILDILYSYLDPRIRV
ncbi:MAG: ABC transporter permease [Thermoproteota archaeon]|nr:ABC transporter permease [Candidatus Brockarchaeota archaeon]